MCTQINDGKREINDLISATTYQGMTDEEIDRIVEYKVNHLLSLALVEARSEALALRVMDIKERNKAICEETKRMVDSHIERVNSRKTVERFQPKIITFDSMEV